MRQTNETIAKTVEAGLCAGCGTCVAVCPKSAITMNRTKEVYTPTINQNHCIHCGVCANVCPGDSIDFEKLNLAVFGNKHSDSLVGSYLGCYTGYSTDTRIRLNSSSGGLVTQLLIFALNQGLIDGAVVTKMSDANPLEPEVFIARTEKEILEAMGSKYCPVAANAALKNLLEVEGKFAFVGLPCHIAGIRKAELINSKLSQKIVYHFGLFCHHSPTFSATNFLLRKIGVPESDVSKIDYRSNGWPGDITVSLKNGEKKVVKRLDRYYWGYIFQFYFSTYRCLVCNDKICQLSDISFGDPWGLSNSRLGESIIVARSKIGEELLSRAVEKGEIVLEPVDESCVVASQSLGVVHRKHSARMKLYRKLGKSVPYYNQPECKPTLIDYADALRAYLRCYISSNRQLERIVDFYSSVVRYIKK